MDLMLPSFIRRATLALVCATLLAAGPASPQSLAPSQGPADTLKGKPDPRKAWNALQEGLRAERRGDWAAAFDAYQLASAYAPDDTDILRHREEARFQMVSDLTEKAERSALAGRLNEAITDLRAAVGLDPGYWVAQERLEQFSALAASQAPQKEALLEGLPRLEPRPGTRSFDIHGETRSAYEEIARQFGLTVSFDGTCRRARSVCRSRT